MTVDLDDDSHRVMLAGRRSPRCPGLIFGRSGCCGTQLTRGLRFRESCWLPARSKSWCESNDPNFTAKAADVVGLYVAPPEKAIVLCVDEKSSIQALERAQGYLKLPDGRALTGQSHDYKRHGTTTLFAALEVATGKIIATHSKRRRRVEFLDFMNSVTAAFPNRKLHVILDNLNTHKKNEHWIKAHLNVQFHFTPTSASWLNQVEVWFSILQGQSLSGASFTSLKQLQEHIDAKAYNDKAEPFVWTKKKVRQRRFKGRRITRAMIPGTRLWEAPAISHSPDVPRTSYSADKSGLLPPHPATTILSRLCFLVLPKYLPEIFSGAETRCSVVVRASDAGMRVVQKRAAEIGIVATVGSNRRCGRRAKQMRILRRRPRWKVWSW